MYTHVTYAGKFVIASKDLRTLNLNTIGKMSKEERVE